MIDLHSHIIYGVDDGASSFKEALAMVKAASEAGYTDVVCTPHFIADSEFESSAGSNQSVLDEINSHLQSEGKPLNLHLGSEIYFDPSSVESLNTKQAATLNKSKYVLVEVPRQKMNFSSLLNYVFQLEIAGYSVVLAHPERYDFVIEDPNHLASLIKRDVIIQMNLLSLTGKYGDQVKKTAKLMLDHNMVHAVATDAHKPQHYHEAIDGLNLLEKQVGSDMFDQLTNYNPGFIINNEIFYPDSPVKIKKKGIFAWLKK
ncbi:tyrosine-protein phosphatase [Alkalibacter saccharofermentans]|uniref:protein-tyrosine-phosphatase n=1 Tax=Alkalibacter saccharofermentans DSM 14828 TaxID=1120975 RepID=A0A1M5A9D2_9FIRM|nr:CpsB/CapC family capsule biosynthesis tyrosine phosphatase [Alkalibacter saccharofermentans]SHF26920.1 protein-tyrosine phosphatase [Alkalibacter saccharofermentans DSM 14828]